MHRKAEMALKDPKAKLALQVKVLLLGSGDSGKSTILKQMCLIHRVPFSPQETESFRQLVFDNLTNGLKLVFDAMDMGLAMRVEDEQVKKDMELIERAEDLGDGEPFPERFYEPLQRLWKDEVVQEAYRRGNEAALPENLAYYFADLPR
ncbi:guanine nucleotide binding protein, alpha subunit [Mycena rebaudengoi]|nr:guanine nucleotide binding protein, alpha subunit [Mycena rebaudengoi]